MADNKSKSIGGLYVKTSAKGNEFLSGFIEVEGKRINIVAFHNAEKKSENTPDYSILVSNPTPQNNNAGNTYNKYGKPNKPTPKGDGKSYRKPAQDEDDDSFPF